MMKKENQGWEKKKKKVQKIFSLCLFLLTLYFVLLFSLCQLVEIQPTNSANNYKKDSFRHCGHEFTLLKIQL